MLNNKFALIFIHQIIKIKYYQKDYLKFEIQKKITINRKKSSDSFHNVEAGSGFS